MSIEKACVLMVDNAGVFMINVDSFIDDTTVFIRKNSEVLIGKLIVSDGILQTACIIYPLSIGPSAAVY